MNYDPKTGEVTTEEDVQLKKIFEVDDEFSRYDPVAGQKRSGEDTKGFGERVKDTLVSERAQDEESLSTFNGTGKAKDTKRRKTEVIDTNTNDSIPETLESDRDSSVSSLSITTKSTINTRLSQQEKKIEDIGSQMDQMTLLMTKICKAMNIMEEETTTIITPQKKPQGPASLERTQPSTGSMDDPANR